MGICDIWREFNPTTRDDTFYSSPHKTYSRVDYFFMYSKDIGFVRSCKIGRMDLSDHSPVYLDLNLKRSKNTFSWRLNLNVLKGKMNFKRKFIYTYQKMIMGKYPHLWYGTQVKLS